MHSPTRNMHNTLTKIPSAKDFAERITNIGANLLGLAHDLVAAIDTRPELVEELVEAGVNRELVNRLERLGRGQIHPQLVFNTSPGGKRLITLPLSEQNAVLNHGGVEILEPDEKSIRTIPLNELTAQQAGQAFHGGQRRSLAEQRSWLQVRKAKQLPPVDCTTGYKVTRDRVFITKPGGYSKKLILQWLTEMS